MDVDFSFRGLVIVGLQEGCNCRILYFNPEYSTHLKKPSIYFLFWVRNRYKTYFISVNDLLCKFIFLTKFDLIMFLGLNEDSIHEDSFRPVWNLEGLEFEERLNFDFSLKLWALFSLAELSSFLKLNLTSSRPLFGSGLKLGVSQIW